MNEIAVPNQSDLQKSGLRLFSPTQINRSTWTGRRKVIGLPGTETWRGLVSVDLIATESEERQWRAFLFGLRGPANWFRWELPCNRHVGPKPTVAAGAGNGYTLPLEGMTPRVRLLGAGQFMTVPLPSGHARTVMLTSDLVADVTGQATAEFSPALNETPTGGVTIETAAPYIPMAPAGSDLGVDTSQGISMFSFDVEEAM